MPHCRLHNALAPLLVAALAGGVITARQRTPAWIDHAGLPTHHSSVTMPNGAPIGVTIASAGSDAAIARLTDTADRTLLMLAEWLGAPPAAEITVVDLPWGADVPGASYPGAVATRMRWITPEKDVSAERSLIAALSRQFWFGAGDAAFREALSVYVGTRAIHTLLEGRDYATPRYAGGFVPMPLRSLILSPNIRGVGAPVGDLAEVLQPAAAPWRFAPVDAASPAYRSMRALQTLERRIGWPAMQQVLAAVREDGGAMSPELFAAIAGRELGTGLDWFVRDLVRSDARIDYAVASVTSEATADGLRSHIVIERRDRGIFSGTDQPRSAGAAASFAASIHFTDGTETRASIDGRDERSEFSVDSVSAPIVTIVDPDQQVLVDADRSNNVWAPNPPRGRVGVRLVANWLVWLQNVMLTYTAIA